MMRPKDLRQGSGTKTFLDAMHGGKVHLARFILDALDGRIINSKTENSRTPLMYAACLQDPGSRAKFTNLLLEKGADVNCQDEDGRTALSLACEMGQLDVVKLLVRFNADPDISDAWGNSALMYAAFSGHSQVVEFLVRSFKRLGLRLDRTNNAGHSAIEVANFFGHNHCVQILDFSCRRSIVSDEHLTETSNTGDREFRLPNKLPRYVLERFSKQFSGTDDQLPSLVQKQLKTQDSNGLWNRFRCPRSQSQDDNLRHSWGLPPQIDKSPKEVDQSVAFAAKQLQNFQLSEDIVAKTLNSVPETRQRDVSRDSAQQKQTSEISSAWGKAKSFNMDLLSSRKQSYQGDIHDLGLSASRLKRASLQDERCLLDKRDSQGNSRAPAKDADKTVPKALLTSKCPVVRALEESCEMDNETSGKREQLKRGSLSSTTRHNKLLFSRGEMDSGKGPGHTHGFVGLGTRLLRRFTAPEFMKIVMDCSSSSSQSKGRISRSETFPFSHTHQQVNSQPSVDSISAVKCEFESCSSQFPLD
ncbi:uncharacterized protein [Eucyclogobius newberryi]|uniref:uncharacterized protein n=1 Tax=Eucyclogobius newberryi TaxID=166745 RepID=UPI003B5C37DE